MNFSTEGNLMAIEGSVGNLILLETATGREVCTLLNTADVSSYTDVAISEVS